MEAEPEMANQKPGQKAGTSGIYSPSKGGAKVAISKGDRLPPTKTGGTWKLTTPANPKKK